MAARSVNTTRHGWTMPPTVCLSLTRPETRRLAEKRGDYLHGLTSTRLRCSKCLHHAKMPEFIGIVCFYKVNTTDALIHVTMGNTTGKHVHVKFVQPSGNMTGWVGGIFQLLYTFLQPPLGVGLKPNTPKYITTNCTTDPYARGRSLRAASRTWQCLKSFLRSSRRPSPSYGQALMRFTLHHMWSASDALS